MSHAPPKPSFALSVGIIGHRPNRLPEDGRAAVEHRIDEVLALLRKAAEAARGRYPTFFTDAPVTLTMISALADGADRMAARAALRNGFALASALPFPIADYEKDFPDPASREEYADLLAHSGRTLVLPGDHHREPRDYQSVGRLVIDNADIILAVWDGGASGGRGGTTELVERAAAIGVPIVHVDAAGKEAPRLLWAELAEYPVNGASLSDVPAAPCAEAIGDVVDRMVRPPTEPGEHAQLVRFLDDRWKRLNWRLEVPLLLALLGVRGVRRTDLLPRAPVVLREELTGIVPPIADPGATVGSLAALADAYGIADGLAVRYAQIFRGAYASKFLFSGLTVVTAAIALVGRLLFDWNAWPLAILQIVFIALVMVNTKVGRKRDWHGRWRESREVAERLRAAIPLWLLGESRHDATGTEPTWPGWYARAHLRALGLWSGSLDRARLEAVRQALSGLADDQRDYHTGVAALMRRVERRMLKIGQILFGITMLIGAVNLILAIIGVELPFAWHYVLVGFTAALPALGTAIFGIRLIGDFAGVAERSARTAATMASIGSALRRDPPDLAVLRSRAAATADAMLGDMSHWRMATETRKLVSAG
jgi:hypothetical protein